MGAFREYLAALAAAEASGAQRPRMDDAKLDELLRRCEWFTAARIVRAAQLGVRDARLDAVAASRGAGLLSLPRVDGSVITAETPDDLIAFCARRTCASSCATISPNPRRNRCAPKPS